MYIVNTKLYRNLEKDFCQCAAWFVPCSSRCVVLQEFLLWAFVLKRDKKQAFYCLCKFVLNSEEIFCTIFTVSLFHSLVCFTPPWYNHVCKMTQWLLFFCYKKNCLSRLCHIFAPTFKLTFGGLQLFLSVMGCVLLLSILALTFHALPISGKIHSNCDVFINSCLAFKSVFLALIWSRFEPLRSSVALNLRIVWQISA